LDEEDEMKTKYLTLFIVSLLLVTLLLGCTQKTPTSEPPQKTPVAPSPQEEYDIKTDPSGIKYIVEPDKIVGGGPPKDGIPSIDNPKYVPLQEADQWIQDNELVLGIIYKGVKRVYPLQIMVWHEIVNDEIAGDPLLITY